MECRRMRKPFLLCLALLVVLNAFFFFYTLPRINEDRFLLADAYSQGIDRLSGVSWAEAAQACQDFREQAMEQSLADPAWGEQLENQVARIVAQDLQVQYEYLAGYQDYLDRIQSDAKTLQTVSFFSDPSSLAYQNTVKTAADFSAMSGIPISAGRDNAVTQVFADTWGDYSILLLPLLLCALFLVERRQGLWPMIYAAPGGRVRLAARRAGLLLAATWVGTWVILGSKILLSAWVFHGLGEFDRTIQSIPMFQNVPTPMTIGQFWLLYLTVKALGAFWIGLVLWAVMSAISNLGLALCAVGLLVGAEYACTAIASSSAFAFLRYCNLFSYVNYIGVFTRYLNLEVLGGLVAGNDLVLAMLLPLCLIFVGVNLAIAAKKRPGGQASRLLRLADGARRHVDPWFARRKLFAFEIRKLLVKRKSILLLILLAVLLAQRPAPNREYDPMDMYLQYYQDKYQGPVTADTIAALEGELATAQEGYRVAALNWMILSAQSAEPGQWIVPTGPYDALWSDNLNNYHRSTALLAMLFLVLCLAPIAAQERQSDMRAQLFAAPAGRGMLWRRKVFLALGIATLVWAMVYATELWRTAELYGSYRCLDAPVSSLADFSEWKMTIGLTMAVYYSLKLLMLWAVAGGCLLLSGLCRKNQGAILACAGVLLVPAALATIGSSGAGYVSFLIPLAGIEVLDQPGVFLAAGGIGAGAMALSWYLQARRRLA